MRRFAPQSSSIRSIRLRNPLSAFASRPNTRSTPLPINTITARSSDNQIYQQHRMSSTDTGELKIEATNIKTAPGVELSQQQQTIVGSVLDLFAGRPSLAKLQLWMDEGEFSDPLTIAKGRKQFEAQWYGLATAFSEIERQTYEVKSSGNPIEMRLKTRYVVKGIGAEKIIDSHINIFTENGKISRVEDKWDGKIPDGPIASAFRRLNANTVPLMVGVPKNAEEDAKKGNQ